MKKATVFVGAGDVTVMRNGKMARDYRDVTGATLNRFSMLSYGSDTKCRMLAAKRGIVCVMEFAEVQNVN